MNVILLHNNHRNVSATHVAIFRVLRKMSTYILRFIKILIKLPEDDSQEGVETYRSASVLTVKTLYCTIVHLLVYFLS